MTAIDVIVILGPQSEKFQFPERMRSNFVKMSSGSISLNFKCLNSNHAKSVPGGYTSIGRQQDHSPIASINYAEGLEYSLDYIDSEYVLFTHIDMLILQKNWDVTLASCLNEKSKLIGMTYKPNERRYLSFPHQAFLLCESQCLLDLRPNLMPVIDKKRNKVGLHTLANENESEVFGRPVGSEIKTDVGWQLPLVYKRAGFDGVCLHTYGFGDKQAQLPLLGYKSILHKRPNFMTEFHHDGKILGSHLGNARRITKQFVDAWYKRIKTYEETSCV